MPWPASRCASCLDVLARAAVHDRRQRAAALPSTYVERRPLARQRALALDADHVEGQVRAGQSPSGSTPSRAVPAAARSRCATRGVAVAVAAITAGLPERGDRLMQAQVVGAEVVTPLGHAMRLVDDEQRHLAPRERLAEGARGEALRRRQHELRRAALDLAQRLRIVALGHARREHARAHAARAAAAPAGLTSARSAGSRRRRGRRPPAPAAGSTATCRRRSASPRGCRARRAPPSPPRAGRA